MMNYYFSIVFLFLSISTLQADPCDGSIVCFANVKYSVVPGCPALVTHQIILREVCPTEDYTVSVFDESGTILLDNPVDPSYFGDELIVTVTNSIGNSCLSILTITDDNAPGSSLPCTADIATVQAANVSAGPGCIAEVVPELILTEIKSGEIYTIELFEEADLINSVDNPVPYSYFGQTIYAKISNIDGNFSVSEVVAEDKSPPYLIFFDDPGNLTCQDDFASMNLAGALDECGANPEVELVDVEFICNDMDEDAVQLTYEATDDFGNTKVSIFLVDVTNFCLPFDLPEDITLNCPEEIPFPPNNQTINIEGCASTILCTYLDTPNGSCGITREYNYAEQFLGLTITHIQHINVTDNTPANFTNNPVSSISYDEFLAGTFSPYLELFDNCGIQSFEITPTYLNIEDCENPEFMVRYEMYAVDNCGNEITEYKDVLVIRDGIARVRVDGRKDCDTDFTISAVSANLVPPLTYAWFSSNPAWTVLPQAGNTALVTAGSGIADISVVVTDDLGCEISDSKRYVCNGRSIQSQSVSTELDLYPNPFQDKISFEYMGEVNRLFLYNLDGKIVKNLNPSTRSVITEIDLSDHPSGVYFLRIITQESMINTKIIKQN